MYLLLYCTIFTWLVKSVSYWPVLILRVVFFEVLILLSIIIDECECNVRQFHEFLHENSSYINYQKNPKKNFMYKVVRKKCKISIIRSQNSAKNHKKLPVGKRLEVPMLNGQHKFFSRGSLRPPLDELAWFWSGLCTLQHFLLDFNHYVKLFQNSNLTSEAKSMLFFWNKFLSVKVDVFFGFSQSIRTEPDIEVEILIHIQAKLDIEIKYYWTKSVEIKNNWNSNYKL